MKLGIIQPYLIPFIKHPRETIIKDIQISTTEKYIDRSIGQLTEAYKKRKVPYFNEVMEIVSDCLERERTSLSILNTYSLSWVCECPDIPFDYKIFSEMNLEIEDVTDAGEWALNISKAMHATHYINPPRGIDLYDKEKFVKAGINLEILKINLTPYVQRKPIFIESLSIIDVMMFNSPEKNK